jgi:hypothetical protein
MAVDQGLYAGRLDQHAPLRLEQRNTLPLLIEAALKLDRMLGHGLRPVLDLKHENCRAGRGDDGNGLQPADHWKASGPGTPRSCGTPIA